MATTQCITKNHNQATKAHFAVALRRNGGLRERETFTLDFVNAVVDALHSVKWLLLSWSLPRGGWVPAIEVDAWKTMQYIYIFSCRSCWRNLAMWVDKCIRRDETIPNFNRYLMRMDTTWRRSIYCRNWLRAAYDHWSWYSHHIRLVLLLYSVPDHRDVITSRVFIL